MCNVYYVYLYIYCSMGMGYTYVTGLALKYLSKSRPHLSNDSKYKNRKISSKYEFKISWREKYL